MAIKRIIGKQNTKYKSCLRCGKGIEKALKDDEVYTCERCGQQHFVDVHPNKIVLTAVEHAYIRRRPPEPVAPEVQKAREELIERVERRHQEDEAWIEEYKDWLEELAALPEPEIVLELSLMDADMVRRVNLYLEKRNKK